MLPPNNRTPQPLARAVQAHGAVTRAAASNPFTGKQGATLTKDLRAEAEHRPAAPSCFTVRISALQEMGSILSSESSREANSRSMAAEEPDPSYDCAVCLEVLNRPMRTRCGHVFCHTCIKASLRTNTYACPYCRTHLSSEGTPAVDIMKKMKTVFQNCEECEQKVCLSDMRAHLNMCEQYITKYGPLEELGRTPCRDDLFACPFCHTELDEDGLVQHCFTYHSTERRLVMCPICHLMPGGDSSYTRSFLKHLHTRHSIYYENYIDINIVEEALIERVLDLSLIHYMRHSNRS